MAEDGSGWEARTMDLVPAGLVLCDANAAILRANAAMLDWLELDTDESLRGRPFHAVLAPAGKIYFETHIRPMLMVEGTVSEIALELRGAERRRVYLNGRLSTNEGGAPSALHFACFEGAQRHAYERELLEKRRAAEAYRALVEASPDAIIHTDADDRVLAWNPAAERLLGHAAADAVGRRTIGWLVPESHGQARAGVLAELRDSASVRRDTDFFHASGDVIPVALHMARLGDGATGDGGILTVARDVRERRANEAMIQTLNREIIHRSNNQFAVIQSIARSTARYSDPARYVDVFTDRLNALSRNLSLLDTRLDAAMSLDQLVRSQLGHLGEADRARVVLDGPDTVLPRPVAEALGLAIFELSTNAVKYGALSDAAADSGRVRVSWSARDGAPLVLDWVESGLSGVVAPSRSGFGSRLTGPLLERSTGGAVSADYRPTGLHWTFTLLLDP